MTGETRHLEGVVSLVVDKGIAAMVQENLQEGNLVDQRFKPKAAGNLIMIPIIDKRLVAEQIWFDMEKHSFAVTELEPSRKRLTPNQELIKQVTNLCKIYGIQITPQMMNNIPRKWEIFGDLAVIQSKSFTSSEWLDLFSRRPDIVSELWSTTAQCLKVTRLARQAEIADDVLRSSQVTMLYGASGEVEFTDYGVKFWLDVTKVMFSSGNVTERHRIGDIDMTGESVIDAFAGIGYYTLPMLVRSNADHVYALELNPNSIFALNRGAKINGVADRLTIIPGDNQESMTKLVGIADRVHLGILPSSESTWRLAVDCLKPTGGILHIHMNVADSNIDTLADRCLFDLTSYAVKEKGFSNVSLVHLEKVKWYAPRIRHIVIDLVIS